MLADKYHLNMFKDSLQTILPNGKRLSELKARFYSTQRKLHHAAVLGHDRLVRGLIWNTLGVEQRVFLRENGFNDLVINTNIHQKLEVRLPEEGTIMFANEPFVDVVGNFAEVQLQEIVFEHAFDLPMTVAYNAMEMTRNADGMPVVDFSLRRDGSKERANDVTRYSYIGGFTGTSNLTGAMQDNIGWVGTAAHYWQQAFSGFENWQQLAFEAQLDANPEGTFLLLDTVSVEKGMQDAYNALNTESRKKAFKGFRIDSKNVSEEAMNVLVFFEQKGIKDLTVVLSGDLDARTIRYHRGMIRGRFPDVNIIFAVGTKLVAETDKVAGVIYKLSEIDGEATMKISGHKSTLPGHLQVFRIEENGYYVKDVIGLHHEYLGKPLLHHVALQAYSLQEPTEAGVLREKVQSELKKFRNIDNYIVEESEALKKLKEETWQKLIHTT